MVTAAKATLTRSRKFTVNSTNTNGTSRIAHCENTASSEFMAASTRITTNGSGKNFSRTDGANWRWSVFATEASREEEQRAAIDDKAHEERDHAIAHDVLDPEPSDGKDRKRPKGLDHVRGLLAH